MNATHRAHPVIVFCLKFVLAAPVCLALWWTILPSYVWTLGQACGQMLNTLTSISIEALNVVTDPSGVLNTKTDLVFVSNAREKTISIAPIANSMVPFIILMLATPGMKIKKMLVRMAFGVSILWIAQVTFLVGIFIFAESLEESPEIALGLGKFLLTLPFVLWIALAYWTRLAALLIEEEKSAPTT